MNRLQKRVVLWVISTVFMITGILKLLSNPLEIAQFHAWGYPLWFMYLTGIINILAAIGLQLKNFFYVSAIALVTLLVLAILSVAIHQGGVYQIAHPALLLLFLVLLMKT